MHPLDKTKWPDGPWHKENDIAAWDLPNGLHALIRRNFQGAWCGYVGVPPTHPWFGRSYTVKVQPDKALLERRVDINEVCVLSLFAAAFRGDEPEDGLPLNLAIRVHGGLTWGDYISLDEAKKDWWYFGFDCAHSGDYQPGMEQFFSERHRELLKHLNRQEIYRTEEYVRGEVAHLSEELLTIGAPCVSIVFNEPPRTSRNMREGKYMVRLKKQKETA
jgi:hypothetical protein